MARKLALLALFLPLVFGCAESSSVTVGGSNVSATYSTPYGGDLSGIEIRRIGNDAIRYREMQDRAINNALGYLEENGVAKERIEQVTIETQGGQASGARLLATAPRYAVWVTIKDCGSSVLFQAGPSGAISSPSDSGGCLGQKPAS